MPPGPAADGLAVERRRSWVGLDGIRRLRRTQEAPNDGTFVVAGKHQAVVETDTVSEARKAHGPVMGEPHRKGAMWTTGT
jgi:hypothetical protein